MHENVEGCGVRAKCIQCQVILNRPNDKEMRQHYEICSQRKSEQSTGKTADSERVLVVDSDSVSAMEIRAQQRRLEFMPGYKSTYISISNGLQRFGQCQVCMCLIKPPLQEQHR